MTYCKELAPDVMEAEASHYPVYASCSPMKTGSADLKGAGMSS